MFEDQAANSEYT